MTRILKLVVNGFKSFGKRTEIVFDNTFNVVLGPNGSGKSNVLDALCFVLGRMSSKSMRAEKLGNLIYNGGKSKKPAERCEVSIFFDNKEKTFPIQEEVVKISRFIKKDGASVYKINDKKATRSEIIDLMAAARIEPDGYNIILQGDIVRFVEMSGEERRMLIEEVAGIGVYEEKKTKALSELGRVDERLREAEILLAERKTHLKELKDDRDQAIKYKEVNDKLRSNKATVVHLQLQKKQEILDSQTKQVEKEKGDIKETLDTIEALKKEAEGIKERIKGLNEEIEQKGEKEQVRMHKDIESAKVELARAQQRLETVEGELTKLTAREAQLTKEKEDLADKTKELAESRKDLENHKQAKQEELRTLEASIKRFRDKHKMEDLGNLDIKIEEMDKAIEAGQVSIQKLVEKKQNLMREQDRLDIHVKSIDERIEKVSALEKEHEKELMDIKLKRTKFKETVLELNQLLSSDSGLASQMGALKKDIAKREEELSKMQARVIGLRERLGGSNRAVKAILENRSKFKGVLGTVVELGKAQSNYALALDVAAGPRSMSIVVETDEVASSCIKYLKTNKLGTATFLPLNKIKPRKDETPPALLKAEGVHGKAIDLISFDSKFKNIFSHVFGSTLVVQSIDTARRIGIGKARMVSLDGDMADMSGAMIGGYVSRKGGTLGFQEDDVNKEINALEGELATLQQKLSDTERVKQKNEERIISLRNSKAEMEGEILKAEKSMHLEADDTSASSKQKKELTEQLSAVGKELRAVDMEVSKSNAELTKQKIERQKLRTEISQLRSPTLIAELNAFEQKKTDVLTELTKTDLELRNAETQAKNMQTQESERIKDILKQMEKERASFVEEKKVLSGLISERTASLEKMEKEAASFYKRYKSLFNEREKAQGDLQKTETKIIRKEEEVRSVEQRNNVLSLRLAELRAQIAGLNAEMEQYAGVQLTEGKSEEQLKDSIYRAERSLTEMGAVNLKALEVYEGVEQQYNSLLSKKETLEKEKNDVVALITEIEERKKEIFLNSFEVVNKNFQEIFKSLSTKGDAYLKIEDPDKPLESGVRILVNLTGGKHIDIRSLSGGEKTMTALAFIFSIQENEPASFYVFDEVDAALDKKNSRKLAELVKKYSSRAQYIVISHNDNVIQEASTLYGVSMDEHGSSNVVSLRV